MSIEPLEKLKPVCRKAAAESIVLLKNRANMLPITENDSIALFGRFCIDYFRSGTGSGGNVNVAYQTGFVDGLSEYPRVKYDEELVKDYRKFIEKHPFDAGNGQWASEARFQEEMALTFAQVERAAKKCNKAFIFIGRTAGEEKEVILEEGSYYLTQTEKQMIDMVFDKFDHVCLVLNVPAIPDLSWTVCDKYEKKLDAILTCWQGGPEGGNGLCDVVFGKVNPSGRLADTVLFDINDHPAKANYGDKVENFYKEDIYVGYRYFESLEEEKNKVMYPFGYGLSYTSFEVRMTDGVTKCTEPQPTPFNSFFEFTFEVTNTGSVAGRTVVQLFLAPPSGELGRPAYELAGFKKTKELAPGETDTFSITVRMCDMGTFDDSGVTGYRNSFVLEKGLYRFYYGENVRDLKIDNEINEGLCEILRSFPVEYSEEAMAPEKPFERLKLVQKDSLTGHGEREVTYEEVPLRTVDLRERVEGNLPATLSPAFSDLTFEDVLEGRASLSEFVSKLPVEILEGLTRGEGLSCPRGVKGTASCFGGLSEEMDKYKIPAICCADGPSGIHMEKPLLASQIPNATAMACTWDPELVEEAYALIGEEMKNDNIQVLLGPGINIHRYPLCGRNFEYFSEDPLLAGKMAAAAVRGLHASGCEGVIKHFCGNNQEDGRWEEDSVISQRALREIYLKPFEIAVKEGGACMVMTSYNMTNGRHTGNCYELTTTILRDNWGFKGLVMTDWWAKLNDYEKGGAADVVDSRSMIRSQNDIYMCHENGTQMTNKKGDNTDEALKNGKLTKGELQRSAMNILYVIERLKKHV